MGFVDLTGEFSSKLKMPLAVVAGADVRADERIPRMLDENCVLTLADVGRHLLLELPRETFIDLGPLLAELASCGVNPSPIPGAILIRRKAGRNRRNWFQKRRLHRDASARIQNVPRSGGPFCLTIV